MSAPNLFLVYVTDTERSTAFYSDLIDMKPVMVTPRYVPFEVAPGVVFALWSGRTDQISPQTPRTSEIGLMLPGPPRPSTPSTPRGPPRAPPWSNPRTTRSSAAPSSSRTRTAT